MDEYSGSFNFFEGELNSFELFHFLINFISQHFVDKDMSQKYFPPLFLVIIFILNGPFSYVDELILSGWVDILELKFLLDHVLEVADVLLPFESLSFQF